MAPIVYRSPLPSVPLYAHSVFTHLFSSSNPNDVGGFNASLPAFIDSVTGTTLNRGQLRNLALALGYGLQKHPTLSARRGDTVMIYSQNSLAWPVVVFGSGTFFQLNFKLWSIKVHAMLL
jgi:4-coumarate--CoA ligase